MDLQLNLSTAEKRRYTFIRIEELAHSACLILSKQWRKTEEVRDKRIKEAVVSYFKDHPKEVLPVFLGADEIFIRICPKTDNDTLSINTDIIMAKVPCLKELIQKEKEKCKQEQEKIDTKVRTINKRVNEIKDKLSILEDVDLFDTIVAFSKEVDSITGTVSISPIKDKRKVCDGTKSISRKNKRVS